MAVGDVRYFSRALEADAHQHEALGWERWGVEHIQSMPHDPIALMEWVGQGDPRVPDDTDGRKDDDGKAQFSQFPVGTLIHVARVLTDGAKHYGSDDNWQRVKNPRKRYYDAAMRHIDSWWGGELIDPKSGRPHLAHAIADLMFLLWFQINTEEQ